MCRSWLCRGKTAERHGCVFCAHVKDVCLSTVRYAAALLAPHVLGSVQPCSQFAWGAVGMPLTSAGSVPPCALRHTAAFIGRPSVLVLQGGALHFASRCAGFHGVAHCDEPALPERRAHDSVQPCGGARVGAIAVRRAAKADVCSSCLLRTNVSTTLKRSRRHGSLSRFRVFVREAEVAKRAAAERREANKKVCSD